MLTTVDNKLPCFPLLKEGTNPTELFHSKTLVTEQTWGQHGLSEGPLVICQHPMFNILPLQRLIPELLFFNLCIWPQPRKLSHFKCFQGSA